MDDTPRWVRHRTCRLMTSVLTRSLAGPLHCRTCCRVASLLYVLRCLPPLFAPSGLIGIILVFAAGGAATILVLLATGVCRSLPHRTCYASAYRTAAAYAQCPFRRIASVAVGILPDQRQHLQVLLVLWCTEPYQTGRMPGALLLRNLLRRYKEQPAENSVDSGSTDKPELGAIGAPPAAAATYDEVIGEMAAGAAQREDPPAALAHGGQYSGWVYTAPSSKYDTAEV